MRLRNIEEAQKTRQEELEKHRLKEVTNCFNFSLETSMLSMIGLLSLNKYFIMHITCM